MGLEAITLCAMSFRLVEFQLTSNTSIHTCVSVGPVIIACPAAFFRCFSIAIRRHAHLIQSHHHSPSPFSLHLFLHHLRRSLTCVTFYFFYLSRFDRPVSHITSVSRKVASGYILWRKADSAVLSHIMFFISQCTFHPG